MHKRKHRTYGSWDGFTSTAASHVQPTTDNHGFPIPDPCLFIQAHEADIVRGSSARSLECQGASTITAGSRSALIRWGASDRSADVGAVDPHDSDPVLWVDRYDVRLLLDHLPNIQPESAETRSLSPSGWSDLPSDSEDTFFFSPDEVEDYRREKRRRLIDHSREERLRVLAAIDGEQDPDPWGGSDEEPDETHRELIRRTASHVISSPNPAQLEMRILANYGGDKRFAFLRGRWSRVWRIEKEKAKQQAQGANKTQPPMTLTPLGGLASYGESDTDSDASEDKAVGEKDVTSSPYPDGANINEDAVKEARRARAREWSAQRRAEQSAQREPA